MSILISVPLFTRTIFSNWLYNSFQVRDFHKKFYRPENLTVILTGQIQAEDVFKAIAVVEDDIIAKVSYVCHFFMYVGSALFLRLLFTSFRTQLRSHGTHKIKSLVLSTLNFKVCLGDIQKRQIN